MDIKQGETCQIPAADRTILFFSCRDLCKKQQTLLEPSDKFVQFSDSRHCFVREQKLLQKAAETLNEKRSTRKLKGVLQKDIKKDKLPSTSSHLDAAIEIGGPPLRQQNALKERLRPAVFFRDRLGCLFCSPPARGYIPQALSQSLRTYQL